MASAMAIAGTRLPTLPVPFRLVLFVHNLKADIINQRTNLHFKCAFNKFASSDIVVLENCCSVVVVINHNLKLD